MRMILSLLSVSILATLGCDKVDEGLKSARPKTNDLGTGLNAVERTYDRPAAALIDPTLASLKSFELSIETDKHDELGGEIAALRPDGHKVTVKITAVDKDHSTISIRVAPGNRDLSEMIHNRIAEKLVPDVKK